MLNHKDFRILAELEKNSGQKISILAKRLGMPRSSLHARIKRLEREGVIRTYKAVLDNEKTGMPLTVMVHIVITSKQNAKDIADRLKKMHNVEEIYIVAGPFDIIIKIRLKNTNELAKFIFGETGLRSWQGVERTESMIVLSAEKEYGLL